MTRPKGHRLDILSSDTLTLPGQFRINSNKDVFYHDGITETLITSGSSFSVGENDTFVATAGQQVFNLTYSVVDGSELQVYLNGLLQPTFGPTETWDVTNQTPGQITFGLPLPINTLVTVHHRTGTQGPQGPAGPSGATFTTDETDAIQNAASPNILNPFATVDDVATGTANLLRLAHGTYSGDGAIGRTIPTLLPPTVLIRKIDIVVMNGFSVGSAVQWWETRDVHDVGGTLVNNDDDHFNPDLPDFKVGPDGIEYNDIGNNYKWFIWYED